MVKFVPLTLTLALRSKILRNNLPPTQCIFPTDVYDGVFHLAYFVNDEVVSVATFFPNSNEKIEGIAYQLRGMATAEMHKGKGYGSELINYAVNYLQELGVAHIWCNARVSAEEFYKKLAFKRSSEVFEIEGVGPHFEMILNLR